MNDSTAEPPPSPPPPEEPDADHAGNAWERRGELGLVEGLVGAARSFIMAPKEAFTETRRSGDLASPVLFAVITGVVTALVGQIWAMLLGSSMLAMLPGNFQQGLGFFMLGSGAGFVVSLFIVPIVTVVWIFLWGAIVHVLLMLVGGLDDSTAGFEGSIRVVSYSSIGNVAKVVPGIGGFISIVWMVVLMVIGLTKLHGTSQGKAVAAVLLPLVLCCVFAGVAVMAGIGAVLSGLGD